MKLNIRLINNLISLIFIGILVLSILLALGVINSDFFIFQMEFFGMFYRKAMTYMFLYLLSVFIFRKFSVFKRYSENIILSLSLIFLFDALGNLFGWYATDQEYSISWYDNLAHTAGGALLALASYFFLKSIFTASNNLLIISAVCLGFTISTLYGVSEYASDLYTGTYMVGGLEDAITDNIWDFSGSLISGASLLIYDRTKRSKANPNNP